MAKATEGHAPSILSPAVASGFDSLRETLTHSLAPDAERAARDLRNALPDWRWSGQYVDLGSAFRQTSARVRSQYASNVLADINRLLVASLSMDLDRTISSRAVPADVLALYPAAATRLLAFLQAPATAEEYAYPNEFFVKDVRFAAGLTVPCGAQVVDLRSTLGLRASAAVFRKWPSLRGVISMVRHGGIAPWFRIHTEMRFLDDFNELGWDACYRRLASLLRVHPDVLGMVGTSWFYDPQLGSISPRLSYLAQNPISRGAFLVRGRTSEFDVRSATSKSDTRRRLYEEGKYRPVPHTLLWPRSALLSWAGSPSADSA